MMMIVCFIFLLFLVSHSEQVCVGTANALGDLDKRGVNYSSTSNISDTGLEEGWYTTIHNGLQYLMADVNHQPVTRYRCGSIYPLYIRTAHPSLSCITETPIYVEYCLRTSYVYTGYCNDKYYIKIRKCSGVIQYYLRPANHKPYTVLAYCFDPWNKFVTGSTGDCPTTTTTTTPTTTTTTTTPTTTTTTTTPTTTTTTTTPTTTTTTTTPTTTTTTTTPTKTTTTTSPTTTTTTTTPTTTTTTTTPTTTTTTTTPTTTTTTTTPTTTTTEKVEIIGITTELKFKTEGRATERQDITPYIVFRCDFLKASGRHYAVSWFVDSVLLITTDPSTNETTFLLHEDTLLDYVSGPRLHGKQMSCSVSLYSINDTNRVVSSARSTSFKIAAEVNFITDFNITPTARKSQERTAHPGADTVKINPVILPKNGLTSLNIEFTLPVGCGYSTIRNEKPLFPCEYSLKVYMKDDWKCGNGGIANIVRNPRPNTFCSEPIKMLESSSQWNEKKFVHSLDIATIDHNYEDKQTCYLQIKFDDSIAHKFWKNYSFPDVKVDIGSTRLYQNKVCYSHVDPHMKTADNSNYEQQNTGYYMLYYNIKYKIEVQIQVEACFGVRSPPTCICGIAVRAGRDVFMINSCGGINYLGYSSCEDHGIIDVIEVGTGKYKIFTPIGTQIDVAMPWFYSKVLNVDIFMSPKDEYNVEGHCGRFDGDATNDFTHRNGGLTANQRTWWQSPTKFSDSWRLSAEENLFLRPGKDLESWDEINKNYCVCKRSGSSLGTQCSPSQSLGCFDSKSLAKRKCRLLTARRRSTSKRADMELRRLFATFSQHQPRTERKRRAVSYNISADEATKLCAELNQSIPLTDLADVSANESAGAVTFQCEYDVVAMNDPSFVSVHTDAMNSVVKTILDLTPSYVTNNSQKVEYFIANSCPMNCSGHGVCTTNGTCSCNGSYRGTDCSIDITQPLTIDDIEGGGACDVAEGDDCQCFTLRTDDLLDNFHCAIDVYKVLSKTDSEKIWSGSNQGEYEDLFTGVCCVNDEHILGRTSSFALIYGFSISNNGVNYGTYVKTYVYDSTCQKVQSTSNGDTVISMKDSFCFIDGTCVENGQIHTSNSCIVCQTDNDVYNWTQANSRNFPKQGQTV